MKPIIPSSTTPFRLGRRRVPAAILAAVMAASCMLPASAAVAASGPSVPPVLNILNVGGGTSELTSKVTLDQLASLLKLSTPALIAQIEALPGNSLISVLLNGLLADPQATLENVLGDVTANGLDAGLVEQLVNSLLAPAVSGSGELQGVIATLLADLAADGQLGPLAAQLDVPIGILEHIGLLPVSDESLAATLNTTIDHLGWLLESAGAITKPLESLTPLVSAPLIGSQSETNEGETVEIVGTTNGNGGVTLTTIRSSPGQSGPAGPGGPVGVAGTSAVVPPALAVTPPVSNAFSILSIKLTRSGLILETVKVPSAGKLNVKATAKGTVARAARNARETSSTKAIKVTPVSANTAAGTRTITLHPASVVKRARHIVVSITTTYSPNGVAANSKHSVSTFKGNVNHRAKRRG